MLLRDFHLNRLLVAWPGVDAWASARRRWPSRAASADRKNTPEEITEWYHSQGEEISVYLACAIALILFSFRKLLPCSSPLLR